MTKTEKYLKIDEKKEKLYNNLTAEVWLRVVFLNHSSTSQWLCWGKELEVEITVSTIILGMMVLYVGKWFPASPVMMYVLATTMWFVHPTAGSESILLYCWMMYFIGSLQSYIKKNWAWWFPSIPLRL